MPDSFDALPSAGELAVYLKSFDFFRRYAGNDWEGDFYAEAHARRFRETLRMIPELPHGARALELGGVPYHMTILLRRFLGLDVETLSFYETERAAVTRHVVESRLYGERYVFDYRAVDVEREPFPFPDAQFDFVFCCELLEHLLINPSNMLYETHRVLRPGGRLLLTTPNVLRWDTLRTLLNGRNIYDGYRGNGIHGRHNREYTPAEVSLLLRANSFEVETIETRNVYGAAWMNRTRLLGANRRDNIFALARPAEKRRMRFPNELFLLMNQYRHVSRSNLIFGVNDCGHLGAGWYEAEESPRDFRWTAGRAEFSLKNSGAQTLVLEACCHHPGAASDPVTLTLRAAGETRGTYEFADHEWHNARFHVGACGDAGSLILDCELIVSRTWKPRDAHGSTDARELGIAVSRARLE